MMANDNIASIYIHLSGSVFIRFLVCRNGQEDTGDFVAGKLYDLLADDTVFAVGLEKRHYFVTIVDGSSVYHVYCVEAEPLCVGIKVNGIVKKLREVFGLNDVSEECVCPWKSTSRGISSEGDVTRFEDCKAVVDTYYQPGSVFLVNKETDLSSCNSCSSRCYEYSVPALHYLSEDFKEAYRETNLQSSEPILVGDRSKSLVLKSTNKPQFERRNPASMQLAPTTAATTTPPIQPHRDLMSSPLPPAQVPYHSMPEIYTAGKTGNDSDIKSCRPLSMFLRNGLDTPAALNQSQSQFESSQSESRTGMYGVDGSLLLNGNGHPLKVSDDQSQRDITDINKGDGADANFKYNNVNDSNTGLSPASNIIIEPTDDYQCMVPGLKSSMISIAITADCTANSIASCVPHESMLLRHVKSAPVLNATARSVQVETRLQNSKSCDLLAVKSKVNLLEPVEIRFIVHGSGESLGWNVEETEVERYKEGENKLIKQKTVQKVQVRRRQDVYARCTRMQSTEPPKTPKAPCKENMRSEILTGIHLLPTNTVPADVLPQPSPASLIHATAAPPSTPPPSTAALLTTGPPSPVITAPPSTSPPLLPPLPAKMAPLCSENIRKEILTGIHPLPTNTVPAVILPQSPQAPLSHETTSPPLPSPSPLPRPLSSPKRLTSISFDMYPAYSSVSPTNKKSNCTPSSIHNGHPIPLHTISDSPSRHVTHLPPIPSGQPPAPTNEMVVCPMPQGRLLQLENTFLQGTFVNRPPNETPGTTSSPTVAQATEDKRNMYAMAPPMTDHVQKDDILISKTPGKFPPGDTLPPEKVVFSRIENVITGSSMPLVDLERSKLLGKGGNGKTYQYPILNKDYAGKLTRYRPSELSEWRRFDHPNVTKILMVSTRPNVQYCCQFMTLMDGNLRDMICEDGVCSMYVNNEQWNTTVKLNVCHVIRSVVKGTAYLHESMCIQLVDLKGSNILIKKKCCCFDIFKCECRRKCIVKLSDFDSVKQFKKNEFMRQYFEWNPYVCMSPDECEKVMGTPGYRAPEQFMKIAPVVSPHHYLFECGLEGPWSDIWSLGLLVLTIYLGPNKPQEKHEAWTMNCQPAGFCSSFSRRNITTELFHPILKSRKLCLHHPRDVFSGACNFVVACTQPEFQKRPSALNLLGHELLDINC